MKTYTSKLTTTIENSDDGLHNYSVARTLEGIEGDKAIVLTLYPSFSGQDLFRMDSTAMHMTTFPCCHNCFSLQFFFFHYLEQFLISSFIFPYHKDMYIHSFPFP